MDKNKNTVLGKALYLEFRRDKYTLQLILTPEALDENGEYQPITLMRRQISSFSPRKTWRFDNAGNSAKQERKDAVLGLGSEFKEITDLTTAKFLSKNSLQFVKPLLSQVFHQGWKLEKQPVAVEFSLEDLMLIREQNTPQGLIRRVLRSRDALGFDKNLFATVE